MHDANEVLKIFEALRARHYCYKYIQYRICDLFELGPEFVGLIGMDYEEGETVQRFKFLGDDRIYKIYQDVPDDDEGRAYLEWLRVNKLVGDPSEIALGATKKAIQAGGYYERKAEVETIIRAAPVTPKRDATAGSDDSSTEGSDILDDDDFINIPPGINLDVSTDGEEEVEAPSLEPTHKIFSLI